MGIWPPLLQNTCLHKSEEVQLYNIFNRNLHYYIEVQYSAGYDMLKM